jgi:hypothetical protein
MWTAADTVLEICGVSPSCRAAAYPVHASVVVSSQHACSHVFANPYTVYVACAKVAACRCKQHSKEQCPCRTWQLEDWQLKISWSLEQRKRHVGKHNGWDLEVRDDELQSACARKDNEKKALLFECSASYLTT